MTPFDELFRIYTFKQLLDITVNRIGYSSLIVLFTAFFAAIIYFSALSSKSRYGSDVAQSKTLEFLQQVFYFFSLLIFLVPIFCGWRYFLEIFLLYLLVLAPMVFNAHMFGRDFSFDEIAELKQPFIKNLLALGFRKKIKKILKLSGVSLTLIVLMAELLALSYFNLSLPLVGWGVIVWSLIAATLQAATVQSYIANIRSCPYVKITTGDGFIEGFIVSKDSDHYVVKTKQETVLLQNEFVKTVTDAKLSGS